MLTLLIFTNKYVRRFLNKQANKEIKVVPSEMSIHDFLRVQLEKGTTTSKSIIELKTRLLIAIGEYQKTPENVGSENEGTTGTTQKTDLERFKDFILENAGEDGKVPSVEEVKERTGLSRKQQLNLKIKLLEEGFLYKVNERTYKLNEVIS